MCRSFSNGIPTINPQPGHRHMQHRQLGGQAFLQDLARAVGHDARGDVVHGRHCVEAMVEVEACHGHGWDVNASACPVGGL